jgi:hypothetical protein
VWPTAGKPSVIAASNRRDDDAIERVGRLDAGPQDAMRSVRPAARERLGSLGEDVIERLLATHMATGLQALRNDVVAPDLLRRTSLSRRTGLPPGNRAIGPREPHELLIGDTVKELHDLDQRSRRFDCLRNDERD